MAIPKNLTTDRPGTSESQTPGSSESPSRPLGIVQQTFQPAQPFMYANVVFLGRPGSGRNSLAWRLANLNDSELPELPSLPVRQIQMETSTRPSLRHTGMIQISIRIVPPEVVGRDPNFFAKDGEVHSCGLIVFIFDVGDDKSSDDLHRWYHKVKTSRRKMPPIIIVGTKADQRYFKEVTPHSWGEGTASTYKARAFVECSAKTNDRVGDVLDAILRVLLETEKNLRPIKSKIKGDQLLL